MPADKLGRYMTSPQFLDRANEAIKKAVERLEAKGIKPACVERRKPPQAALRDSTED